jgi:phosphotransferase system enzyme I (PtsI)
MMMVVDSESDARGTSDENALPPEQAEHEIEPPIQFSGVTVFNGVALGQAQILSEGELEVPHFSIDKPQTRAEFTRLRAAISRVSKELDELANNASFSDAMTEALAFVDLHRQILNDESLISETQNIIRERLINAEWALAIRLEEIRKAFEAIDDEYLAERVEDIAQVIERIQRELSGRRRPADTLSRTMSEGKIILIARDLNPTDILILKRRRDVSIAGLITETGSQTSHTAILARSLEIPSLVSVPGVTEHIQNDDVVLLDADKGILIAHPDSTSLPTVATRIRELTATKNRHRRLRNKKNVSLDGQPF